MSTVRTIPTANPMGRRMVASASVPEAGSGVKNGWRGSLWYENWCRRGYSYLDPGSRVLQQIIQYNSVINPM